MAGDRIRRLSHQDPLLRAGLAIGIAAAISGASWFALDREAFMMGALLFAAGAAAVVGVLLVKSKRKRRHFMLTALSEASRMSLRDRSERADYDSLLMLEQPGQHIEYLLSEDEHNQLGLWPQVIGGNRGGAMKSDRGFIRLPNETGMTPGILVSQRVNRGLYGIPGRAIGQLETMPTESWNLRTVAGETDIRQWRESLHAITGSGFEQQLASFDIEVTPHHIYLFAPGAWDLREPLLLEAFSWTQRTLPHAFSNGSLDAPVDFDIRDLVMPRRSQGKAAVAWTVGIISGIIATIAASIVANDLLVATLM